MVDFCIASSGRSLQEYGGEGQHIGSVQIILVDSKERNVSFEELVVMWEKATGSIPGAEAVSYEGMEAGPPGKAIEIWLQGQDMDKLLEASNDLQHKLRQYEGVYQVQTDFRPGKNEMRLSLKPEARTLGITVQDLAGQVYAGYFGEEAVRLQRGRDDLRVRVRYTKEERSRVSELRNVRIRTPEGHEVPLYSIANVEYGPGYSTITRTDSMRRVAVTAEVNKELANSEKISRNLEMSYYKQLTDKFQGVYISTQGQKKDSADSVKSLQAGFPLQLPCYGHPV